MMTRRNLVGLATAGALAARPFTRPIGVQLYTCRTLLPKDPDGVLKAIAGQGYKEVELFSYDQLEKYVPIAKKYGMTAPSIHMPAPIVTGNWKPWMESMRAAGVEENMPIAKFLDAAVKSGIRYAGLPYLRPDERGTTPDYWKQLTDRMNKAGEASKKTGITFFYHNHSFEFAGEEGARPIDIFFERLDPQNVKLELDVFWVAAAGGDPVAVMNQWKGRIACLHLKDIEAGAPKITLETQAKPSMFKEVGTGALDFKKILNTAATTGVEKYFVEHVQAETLDGSHMIMYSHYHAMRCRRPSSPLACLGGPSGQRGHDCGQADGPRRRAGRGS